MLSRLSLLSLFAIGASALSLNGESRPNIIIIMSDDMGYSDIGCYGGEIKTPNLDKLATNGLRFAQFYNTGRCCPTRASLLTGLYPHQAGIGHMTGDYGLPQYQGFLNQKCVTIAEALKPAGYRSYLSGKWHVTPKIAHDALKNNWPRQRGFDKFFGTIHGAGSLFDPNSLTRDNTQITPENDPEYKPKGTWYYTDAISDNTVMHLESHFKEHPGKPFFHYVAYTAAHWPMHALPEDIAKYEGKYDDGYKPVYEARLKKMKALGLIDPNWTIPGPIGDWDKVKLKEWESACMEVYAAMVDNMDQGIGRIVATLEKNGQLDNTLILFLQDNGGCAEGFGRGKLVGPLERPSAPTLKPMGKDELQTNMVPPQSRDGYPLRRGDGVMPGPPETEIGYGKNWANVSNTPFREYKHWVHEGGIATPLVAHWPKGITLKNKWAKDPSHLIDLMATCLDLGKASYPDGKIPVEGISSFLPSPAKHSNVASRSTSNTKATAPSAMANGNWSPKASTVPGSFTTSPPTAPSNTTFPKNIPNAQRKWPNNTKPGQRNAGSSPLIPGEKRRTKRLRLLRRKSSISNSATPSPRKRPRRREARVLRHRPARKAPRAGNHRSAGRHFIRLEFLPQGRTALFHDETQRQGFHREGSAPVRLQGIARSQGH